MAPTDLQSYLALLEQAGRLKRIQATVDPHLELAAIVDRVCKGGDSGQALLFEDVRGAGMAVAANLFGSLEQVGWALGTTDIAALARRLGDDLVAAGEVKAEQALTKICNLAAWQPAVTDRLAGRVRDQSDRGLDILPRIVAWPADGGPFLTQAQVYTRDPETGAANCGMYRIQCHDRHRATIRCRAGSDAARHLAAWHARNTAMPVAVVLGGPPVLAWVASAPLPYAADEVAFGGYLLQQRLEMSRCRYSDLLVPASAEIVIEGVVEPGSTAPEGPFGNHTGRYDAEAAAPLMKVLSVQAATSAICPWTLVGPPPMENIHLARATVRLFTPLVKMALPTVRAVHLPAEGIFHRAAIVTLDAKDTRPLAEVAGILRGTLLLRNARLLVVAADDHDPRDIPTVFWQALNAVDWRRDLLIEDNQLTIDARYRPAGALVRGEEAVLERVLRRWHEFGFDTPG